MQEDKPAALVTGASSGIGRAVARALAGEGRMVWAVARREDLLAELAAPAGQIRPVPADLATPEGRTIVTEAIGDRALGVAVHAAGVLGPPGTSIEDYPAEAWYEVFEINVSAVHFLHQAVAPAMHRALRPTVIGVSSSVGRVARAGWGMYGVSKFALEGWLATLALEWGEAGRVYSVNPGGTATAMRALAMPDEDPATLPTPEDLVPLFLELADPACSHPSGSRFEARDHLV